MAEIIFLDPDRPYWIEAEAMVTVPGEPPLANGFLAVRGGRIEAVGTDRSLAPAIFGSPSCENLHLRQMLLFPALVDGHVHLGLRGMARSLDAVEQCLGSGIAALRDGGDRAAATLLNRERLSSRGVRIHACGWAIHHPNGYGGFLGAAVSNYGEFLGILEKLEAMKADFVKLIVSGMVDFDTGELSGPSMFHESELKRMVQGARERGLWVMAHANSDEAVMAAVRAGVRSVEHGYLTTRQAIRCMADHGAFWTPTLLPVHRLGLSGALGKGRSARAAKNLRRIYARHEENLCLAHALGVRLVAGSDAGAAGVEPGTDLHQELCLMVEAGLPWDAALKAATLEGAEVLYSGRENPLGSLAPGKRSHILGVSPDCLHRPIRPEDVQCVVTLRPGK